MLLPITSCTICGLHALSPEARCKTFDASADGYGRGEAFAGACIITPFPCCYLPVLTALEPLHSGLFLGAKPS